MGDGQFHGLRTAPRMRLRLLIGSRLILLLLLLLLRVWLLVRADTPEVGFTDTRFYEYGDRSSANGYTADLTSTADSTKAYRPSDSTDTAFTGVQHYRRMLICKTIQVRNSLGT